MSQDTNIQSHELLLKALDSGDELDIANALKRATLEAKYAMTVLTTLGLKFPDLAKRYCRTTTELPCVYSSDESLNRLLPSIAKELELGADAKFNYSGDRRRGIVSKLAVERVIEIIDEIRKKTSDIPDEIIKNYGELGDALIQMKQLPKLDSESEPLWRTAITEYVLTWFHATEEEKSSKLTMAFPTIDLAHEAQSYAESRLEARRAEKMKTLNRNYPDGERLNKLWNQGERKEILDYAFELSDYQGKLKGIESMQLDRDCWKYAIDRLVGEKLERLLRP